MKILNPFWVQYLVFEKVILYYFDRFYDLNWHHKCKRACYSEIIIVLKLDEIKVGCLGLYYYVGKLGWKVSSERWREWIK